MINTHVGITPKYRGVHGGYWALVEKNIKCFGTTVHLVDSGIDTGCIIAQKAIQISRRDNFSTYPLLQVIEGLECLDVAIKQAEEKKITITENTLDSNLFFHPTITKYLFHRLINHVK